MCLSTANDLGSFSKHELHLRRRGGQQPLLKESLLDLVLNISTDCASTLEQHHRNMRYFQPPVTLIADVCRSVSGVGRGLIKVNFLPSRDIWRQVTNARKCR